MVYLCSGVDRAGDMVHPLLLVDEMGGYDDENIRSQAAALSVAFTEQNNKRWGVVILLFYFAYVVQTVQQGETEHGNQL